MEFPIADMLDYESSVEWILKHFHPEGLRCPKCRAETEQAYEFRRTRWTKLIVFRCKICGTAYNLYTGTVLQGAHLAPEKIVLLMHGICKGEKARKLAAELQLNYRTVLFMRRKVQSIARLEMLEDMPLTYQHSETVDMFQNVDERMRTLPGDKQVITLVHADNHPIVRAGIRAILNEAPDIHIVGEIDNSNDVQSLIEQLRPRLLLLDLKIPNIPTFEVIKWVRTEFPETAILALTTYKHDAYLANVMDAGAAGLINIDIPAIDLIEAIRRAAQNEILFDQKQMERAEQWRKSAGEKWARLSKRQRQILQLLAQGISRVNVAVQLDISTKMVDYHIGGFLERLKVKSLMDAVNWLHKYFPENSGSIT